MTLLKWRQDESLYHLHGCTCWYNGVTLSLTADARLFQNIIPEKLGTPRGNAILEKV